MALYMDVHIRWAITAALRRRGMDVLTAQEDGLKALDMMATSRPPSLTWLNACRKWAMSLQRPASG